MQEESDHLALAVGHDLRADDDLQVERSLPRALDRLEAAGDRVVIRDGDRAEAALERLVEQVVDRRRTVRRVVRVHVQVREDERAVGARRGQRAAASGSPPRRKLAVQRLDLGRDLGEGLSRGDGAPGARQALAQRDVLEQAERDRARELGGVGRELEAAHIGLDQLHRRRALAAPRSRRRQRAPRARDAASRRAPR